MKIRKGFVSNSSSSSFMILIAKVQNETAVRKFLESIKVKEDSYYVNIKTPDELVVSSTEGYSDVSYHNHQFVVESFRGDEVSIQEDDIHWMFDKILVADFCNNEGDGAFQSYEYSDIDYDIDLGFLPDQQISIYEEIGKVEGVSHVNKCFGAARDG